MNSYYIFDLTKQSRLKDKNGLDYTISENTKETAECMPFPFEYHLVTDGYSYLSARETHAKDGA